MENAYIVIFTFIFAIMGYLMGSILFGVIISKIFKVDIKSKGSGNLGSTNVLRTCGFLAGFITFLWDSMKGWLAIFFAYLIYVNIGHLVGDLSKAGYVIYVTGLFAIIGHCYPLHYLYFLLIYKFDFEKVSQYKGGKGAATTAGVYLALSPWVYIICFILFWIILYITKYVSVSSIVSIFFGFVLLLIPNIDYFYMLDILGEDKAIIIIKNPYEEFIKPSISFSNNWMYLFFPFVLMFSGWVLVVYKHKVNIMRLLAGTENKMMQKKKIFI